MHRLGGRRQRRWLYSVSYPRQLDAEVLRSQANICLPIAGPIPRFEGLEAVAIPRQTTGDPIAPQITGQMTGQGAGPIRIPPLTVDECTKFAALFDRSASNGIISGK